MNVVAGIINNMDLLVYVIIAALFVLGIIKCVAPVIHTRRLLKRAIHNIKSGQNAKYSWQEDDFLGKGSLFPHWSEYLNNLFFADGAYHNASNVEDYINEETAIYEPGHSSFSDAIPGLLVSMGFMGTLIGLMNGLMNFNMESSSAVQSSIEALIPSMKYAFMTSIAGVIASVAFTIIVRFVYGSTERTIKSFYGAMSRYAGVLSVDPMTQIAIYQQEQTALIQTMAEEIRGGFSDRLIGALNKAIEPVNQTLGNFITVTTKEQMRFLDAVAGRFVERMDASLSGRFKEFGDMLHDSAESQKSALAAVSEGISETMRITSDIKRIQKISDEVVSKLAEYLDTLNHSQIQSGELYARMTNDVERLDLVSRQQTSYLKSVSQLQTELTEYMENFLGDYSKQTAAAASGLMKAAGEIRATGAQLENIHAKTGENLSGEFKEALDGLSEYAAAFARQMDYTVKDITDSIAQLPQAVNDTADQFIREMNRISKTLEKGCNALDDAVDRLYASKQ